MKIITLIGIVLATMVINISAAEKEPPYKPSEAFYGRTELNISPFAYSQSADTDSLDHDKAGAGVEISFFTHHNFGIGLELSSPDTDRDILENVSWHGIYRLPIGRSAPYIFGGLGYDASKWDDMTAHGGVGTEFRLSRRFGVFADTRYVSDLDGGSHFLSRAGLRISF